MNTNQEMAPGNRPEDTGTINDLIMELHVRDVLIQRQLGMSPEAYRGNLATIAEEIQRTRIREEIAREQSTGSGASFARFKAEIEAQTAAFEARIACMDALLARAFEDAGEVSPPVRPAANG